MPSNSSRRRSISRPRSSGHTLLPPGRRRWSATTSRHAARWGGALALTPPGRIVEFGGGWGNLTSDLAAMGHDVTVVEIDAGFCRLIEGRVPCARVVEAGMLSFIRGSQGDPFDAAVFCESFHHCAAISICSSTSTPLSGQVGSCWVQNLWTFSPTRGASVSTAFAVVDPAFRLVGARLRRALPRERDVENLLEDRKGGRGQPRGADARGETREAPEPEIVERTESSRRAVQLH